MNANAIITGPKKQFNRLLYLIESVDYLSHLLTMLKRTILFRFHSRNSHQYSMKTETH